MGGCQGERSSQKGVPYRAQCSSAVKIGGFPLQMDVQGFNCFPSWVVGLHMLDCRCLPVHLVLLGPCMYCDAVLHIVSLHCSFVFTYPLLQCSSCFSHVDTLAFDAWYIPGTRLLSSSTLVGSHLLAPRLPRGFPSIWRLSWCKGACTSSPLSCWHLSHMISGGTGGVVCSCSSVQVEEWGGCGWFLRVWFTICAEPPPPMSHIIYCHIHLLYKRLFFSHVSCVYQLRKIYGSKHPGCRLLMNSSSCAIAQ